MQRVARIKYNSEADITRMKFKSRTVPPDLRRRAVEESMKYRVQRDCENINWQAVNQLLVGEGLAAHPSELRRKAFENSYCVVFVFDIDLLVGVGRAISDGAYQAAVYDIAVLTEYQGKTIGRIIMNELHKDMTGFNIILYAMPGKEAFYNKFGYYKMLTGMANFENESMMREKGFIE